MNDTIAGLRAALPPISEALYLGRHEAAFNEAACALAFSLEYGWPDPLARPSVPREIAERDRTRRAYLVARGFRQEASA